MRYSGLAVKAVGVALGAFLLLGGSGVRSQAPTRTPLPTLTASPTFSLIMPTFPPGTPTQPAPQQTQQQTAQPSPTSPLLVMTATPPIPATNTPPPIQSGNAPPLTIQVPPGWGHAFQRVPIRAVLAEGTMNVAIYRGPLKNGIGTIVLLWGFPSIGPRPASTLPGLPSATPGGPPADIIAQMLWSDGLRMLQGTVVDITCNVGTSGPRTFTVGGLPAIGTYFNISQCQGEPDTAGWFAGINQYGRSYLFYAYIEPIQAYNDARGDLQKILDTVVFLVPQAPTATAGR